MDNRQQRVMRPARIVVDGPLAPFADGMRKALAAQGYAGDTITDHVHLLADLSGWLASRDLTAADLTSAASEEFAAGRRGRGFRTGTGPRAVIPVVEYLRSTGAAPPAETRAPGLPGKRCWRPTVPTSPANAAWPPGPSRITCGMHAGSWTP